MAEMSNYLENALINGTLRATTYTAPTTVYVGLYTSDPTDANTGTEVTGGFYVRTAVTFGAPSDGVTTKSAAVEFPQATADWGVVGWIGILDASTSGNLLYHSPLDVSKTISSGDVLRISIGALSVTLA
jgi:flagellar hook-associated protein FlgK